MTSFSLFDHQIMQRCLQLAGHGRYHVGLNPLVGAVITYNHRIIGEGYHKKYGGPHAEIEALNNVKTEHKHLLPKSHLFVSLEPCNHQGQTPPCVEAILAAKIPEVTICNIDPNPKMRGQSVLELRARGIKVNVGLREKEGYRVNQKFFVNQNFGLPLVILKWAQSKDGFIGNNQKQVSLSNEQSNLLVHRWREEIDAIMVGTNTVIIDDPKLTNRRNHGRSPKRIILDRAARISMTAQVLSDKGDTLVFTTSSNYPKLPSNKTICTIEPENWTLANLLNRLYQDGISSVLIEGGSELLKSCIHDQLWHEARIIHTPVTLTGGIRAPSLSGSIQDKFVLGEDKILIINNLKIDQSQM